MRASDKIIKELKSLSNKADAEFLPYFFKTGKGEYGEGDKFLGVRVPQLRALVKHFYKELSLLDIEKLLENEYHECRHFGVIALTEMMKKAKKEEDKKEIFDFYLAQTKGLNNWDLVDVSCHKVVGAYLIDKPDKSILYKLADSKNMWEQRIAIVSNWMLIKYRQFDDLVHLSEKLLHHPHDLMHKAIGWMLREMGKVEEDVLFRFLDKHHKEMPRTMLRYSIEKLSDTDRKHYMQK